MTRARVVILVFAVLLAVLAVAGFLGAFKRVDEEVDVGYRGVAAVNPFHAAELLLEELGVPSESRYGLGVLPPTDHVVVVLAPTGEARRPLADRLYEWVDAGGHLVVAAPSAPSHHSLLELLRAEQDDEEGESSSAMDCTPEDPLLEAAGLFLEAPQPKDRRGRTGNQEGSAPVAPAPPADGASAAGDAAPAGEERQATADGGGDETSREDGAASPRSSATGRCAEGPRETVIVGGMEMSGEYEAKLDGARLLAIHEEVEDENGFTWEQRTPVGHVARVPVGHGVVTALIDSWFLSNDAIGELDHATLLAELVSTDGLPAGALFVLRGEPASFLSLVASHGWMILVSLFVLVALWARKVSRRFGPVLPDPSTDRRRLLEHVEASGAFLWDHGHHWELLESTRRAVRERLAASLPGASALEGGELAEAVSAETGIRASRVHEAFYGAGPRDQKHFTEAMQELQRLWRRK